MKGGRQRLPYFLYSDFLDVGYAYHWISPPSEVYAVGGFDNLDGVNLEYFGNWGDATSRINLMFGGTSVDSTQDFSVDTRNHWLISWDLNWNWLTLHMSYSETSTTVSAINDAADAIAGVMAGAGFPLTAEQYDALTVDNDKGNFAGIGLIADFGDWFAGAEWTTAGIKDTVINTEKDAWFVTGGYRYDKFTISLTYANYDVPNDSIGYDALAADQIPLLPGTQDVNFFLDQAIAAASNPASGAYSPFTSFSLTSLQDSLVNAVMLGGYEADSYNITVRYDFHPSAAFKFDYTAEEATYYHTGRNIEPQLVRMGVDLVF